jgi:shikimate dehydrogenase
MHLYGLIGHPLSHSFSPQYFNEKFKQLGLDDHEYRAFDIPSISELPALLTTYPALAGLNVTIPYKQSVLAYTQWQHETVKACGAANCLKITSNGIEAYNTDVTGFENSLRQWVPPGPLEALVLGTGGASRAVQFALQRMHIPFLVLSRQTGYAGQLLYQSVDKNILQSHRLIINTTPLGMYPQVEGCPDLPYHLLGPEHYLYDLVYRPEETQFLQKGKAQGSHTKNGYDMLILQAEAAWEVWKKS